MNNDEKKLDKFLDFAEDPKLAVYDELIEIGENIDELSDIFENVDLSQLDYIQGEKGDKGDKGDKGEKGDTGEKGKDGIDGKDGINGTDGIDGIDGKDGKDGIDGKDGKDGSPDAPEDIVNKLESLSGVKRLKATAIQGIEDFVKLGKDGYPKNLPQPAASLTYKLNGAQTGRGNILNVIGNGITSSTDGDTTTYDLSGLSADTTWGSITGTITNQADLVSYIDGKLGVSTDAYNALSDGSDTKPYLRELIDPVGGNVLAEIVDDFVYVTPLSGASSASHAMSHTGSNVVSITNTITSLTNQAGVVVCTYNGSGDDLWSMTRTVALGNGEIHIACHMRRPNDSGAANKSNLRIGLRIGTGDGTDGVFFKLNEDTNSNRWQCITRASSVSTTTNTSVTTTKGTWFRVNIVINPAGDEAKFYINGTLVATHTTNMPAVGTALTGIMNMELTVVSSTITWAIDLFACITTFTTPR